MVEYKEYNWGGGGGGGHPYILCISVDIGMYPVMNDRVPLAIENSIRGCRPPVLRRRWVCMCVCVSNTL